MSTDEHDEELEQLMEGLTPKQVRFCHEYLVDLNSSAAYERAGYVADRTRQNATRLRNKKGVKALIAKLAQDQAMRTRLSADQVLAQTARLAFSDIRKIVEPDGGLKRIESLDDDTAASIESVKVSRRPLGDGEYDEVVEYKMASKRGSLDLLGKHLKLWVERIEVGASDDMLDRMAAAEARVAAAAEARKKSDE